METQTLAAMMVLDWIPHEMPLLVVPMGKL
jgi:hypothetical protein